MTRLSVPPLVNIATWFVDRPAEAHPHRIAVLGEPARVDYGALQTLTNQVGRALKRMGCQPRERVLLVLPDSVEFIAAFYGSAKIGAIAVPVSPGVKTIDYAHYLTDSGARVVIAHDTALPQLLPALSASQANMIVVGDGVAPGAQRWNDVVLSEAPALAAHPTAADDPAFFLYTSGSTGLSKAVVHRHGSMLVTNHNFGQGVLGIGPDDRTLSVPKLFFAYGLGNGMYFPLAAGASTILNPAKTDLDTVVRLIGQHHPTLLFAVPTFLTALFKEIENGLTLNLDSIRAIVYGGEPAPTGLFQRMQQRLGIEMLEGFGSTEMLQTFISNRPGRARVGTCGFAVPGYDLELKGADDNRVADGEIGTLWIRGASAFSEYWGRPELTSRTKVGEWVVTSDRMYLDAEGYFHFCGRADDMLKISGMWVSPREIELILQDHPVIREAAVAIQPGRSEMKQLVAYVVPKKGSEPAVSDLRRYVADRVPEHMIPAAFVLLAEMPLTSSGKIDRQNLPQPSLDAARQPGAESTAAAETRTATEMQLEEIWLAVLNLTDIRADACFADLGGDSVLAMQCLSRIRKTFQAEIAVEALFEATATLREIARLIDAARVSVRA